MKYLLIAVALAFTACDKPPAPKVAGPQREALDKAKAVEQTMQREAEASKRAIDDATE